MEETLTNDDNKHVDGGNASGNASGDVEMADGADAGAGAGGSAGGGASTATLAIADDDRASLAVRAVRACVAGSRKRRRAFRAAALSALARVMGSVREGGERAAGAAGGGTRAALRECAEGLVEGTLRPAMAAVGAEEGSGGGGGGGGNAGGAGGGSTGGGGTEGAAADEGGHAPLAEGLEVREWVGSCMNNTAQRRHFCYCYNNLSVTTTCTAAQPLQHCSPSPPSLLPPRPSAPSSSLTPSSSTNGPPLATPRATSSHAPLCWSERGGRRGRRGCSAARRRWGGGGRGWVRWDVGWGVGHRGL